MEKFNLGNREKKVLSTLKKYGFKNFQEMREFLLNKGIEVEKTIKSIQPIAFDDAVLAYELGCAIALKDGAKNAYNAIGKAYLAIVAVLGQLVSDVKDTISEAYNKFIDGVKEFADEVKAYVSEKWDTISKWCKKTATAFADGVKNVWEKTKDKVKGVVDSVKGAYKTLKDNAKATWEEIVEWNDERQQEDIKAKMKYAADKWGKDTVESWVNEL
jgi:gas vesicle protein